MSGYEYWNNVVSMSANALDYVVDKRKSSQTYMTNMFVRLQKMFQYNGLPDTIPREMLEDYLLRGGSCYITKVKGKLYAFQGTFGGEPDPYYRPTLYIIANPALKFNKTLDLWEDGVLMRNNSLWQSIVPLVSRYAALMAENILTMRVADIMLRVTALITAPNDSTKIAGEEYLRKLEKGQLGVIAENRFLDGIKMQSPPSNNGSYLTQFIELQQYLKASFYHEIGLDANYNMKREAIGDSESALNRDSLLPLCEDMLRCRQEDVDKVNQKYGIDITVDFDSAWYQNVIENELQLQAVSRLTSDNGGDSGAEGRDTSNISGQEEGSISDNGAGASDTDRGNGSESDGANSVSVRAGGRSSQSEHSSAQDDVSDNRDGVESDVRVENGDEEVDAGQSESEVVVNVNITNIQGGESDASDNGGDGEERESGDKDS